MRVACFFSTKICIFHLIWHDREDELFRDACNWTRILILRTRKAMLRRGAWGFWTRIARITRIIFLRTWIFLVNAWCVGVLNTDCTDYTDNLLENTEFFVIAWCVVLNTDCTDYFSEDADNPLGSVMRRVLNTDCTDSFLRLRDSCSFVQRAMLMMLQPRADWILAIVWVVKLCLPVSHLEISESLLWSILAKSFCVRPFSLSISARRSAMLKDNSNSAFWSEGIAEMQSRNSLFCIMMLIFQMLHFLCLLSYSFQW